MDNYVKFERVVFGVRHHIWVSSERVCQLITKKKVFIAGIIKVIFQLIIMVFTTPTQAEFDKWILKENEIVCENNVL